MSTRLSYVRQLVSACLLISLGMLSACGSGTNAKTATATVDTTVFDDDTLEAGSAAKPKKTERALETEKAH